jgi:hypothetical protein
MIKSISFNCTTIELYCCCCCFCYYRWRRSALSSECTIYGHRKVYDAENISSLIAVGNESGDFIFVYCELELVFREIW